ncbi:glutathione S-transferase family protein [Pelomonas aquatica]|jgi:glutathione S-transferase|uniref:Glutathione S-transferase family protein n=1 Tax=Pelomonas aquatica TaxID=431058 RepID=A0A9X4LJN8_9BURK|nr:glutathione S-transferase family protein [Pelomonas aquatica]MCY4756594.1 glutathione S-transferase family protein [Pelomonas aquatica]MDG0863949.1 glutathione S-transferase family protein [Pelomonas aquatica]
MLTLYHSPGSFSSRILWLLEELEADYAVEIVSYPKADGSNADPRNPHPRGYTPALSHDGHVVTETGAIALYLTDLFPQSPVGVPSANPLRGRYLTWLFYQVGLTEPLVYMKGRKLLAQDAPMRYLDGEMMKHIEATLAAGRYILGDRFTAVDILCMSLFEHARPLLDDSALIDAYLARADRPARRRAAARVD